MKNIEILRQHRNDYTALMQCEHCGTTRKNGSGYDDANYENNVIPAMHCHVCKKNRAGELQKEVA